MNIEPQSNVGAKSNRPPARGTAAELLARDSITRGLIIGLAARQIDQARRALRCNNRETHHNPGSRFY